MKELYKYTSVKLPLKSKKIIDDIFEEQKVYDPTLRKADLWLKGAQLLLKENKKLKKKKEEV